MNRKVLFIDTAHPVLKETIENMGFQCDYYPHYSRSDFEKCIGEYEGIIIRSKILLDKLILEKAIKLRFIGRVGSGLENIDTQYAASRGIACFNSPEGNRDAVGEQALGMLICLTNNILLADREVRQGTWIREGNRGNEIKGKTIGIIGYGNTGNAFARKLKGFEAEMIAYDKYKKGFSDEHATEATMDEIFEKTDILSLHVPLSSETRYLVNKSYLKKFKKSIFLINTSRGPVVNTKDLVEALKSGKVSGAALDVLEYEELSFESLTLESLPGEFHYLAASDKVVMTPHIAGWTHESHYKLAKVLADKIKDFNEIHPA